MASSNKRTYSRYSIDAVKLLGQMIQLHRKQRKMTLQDLADRAGISRTTLSKIEAGHMGSEIGLFFEVASLVGVTLFNANRAELTSLRESIADKLALLPKHTRTSQEDVDDDF